MVADSAAGVLRGGAVESGQGRWDELRIEGLSFGEFLRFNALGQSAQETLQLSPNSVERYLTVGGFPEHALSDDYNQVRELVRKDIAERAILRDLLILGLDVERLRKLFVYLIRDSGAIFNASIRARDLGADPRSVAEWARALEDTGLVTPLPRHTERAAVALRSHPKIYAADHGLVVAFTPRGSVERDQRARSRAFEAVVFRHLRDVANLVQGELSFLRDRDRRSNKNDDLEADFVLTCDDGAVVIEVTSSPTPSPKKFNRLFRAGEILKTSRLVMIHGGSTDSTEDRSISLSLARFLSEPEAVLDIRK